MLALSIQRQHDYSRSRRLGPHIPPASLVIVYPSPGLQNFSHICVAKEMAKDSYPILGGSSTPHRSCIISFVLACSSIPNGRLSVTCRDLSPFLKSFSYMGPISIPPDSSVSAASNLLNDSSVCGAKRTTAFVLSQTRVKALEDRLGGKTMIAYKGKTFEYESVKDAKGQTGWPLLGGSGTASSSKITFC